MKRSEAIAKIKESLGGFTPDDDKVANWILKDLEALGMVPPIIEEKSWQMLPSGEMVYAVHEWEEE